MKSLYTAILLALAATSVRAQITIAVADMPSAGDTPRHSLALPLGSGINLAVTGPNQTWNFSSLAPIAQGIDTFRTLVQVNPAFALSGIPPMAVGYKVADSIPAASNFGFTVKNVYTFFSKKAGPSRYVAEGGALTINSVPVAAPYSDEDEIYLFPLQFGNVDSTTFLLNFSFPGFGSYRQEGYRKNTVDGWGTIVTPYTGSTAIQVIRVRSEVVGSDSFTASGASFSVPRNTVEYKWLANGERYPLLWVTANKFQNTEVITDIRYRDTKRTIATGIGSREVVRTFELYPNPATNMLHLKVPSDWQAFNVRVHSSTGALISSTENTTTLDVARLAAGTYWVILKSGTQTAIAKFQK